MSALEITELACSYGPTRVLEGIDLEVEGGITAILGSSGCGKTTLLRLIAGFLEPDAGRISIGGRPVAGAGKPVPPRDRRVGFVPQEGALFPHLDVASNIAFGLPRAERKGARVAEMLELVELPASAAQRSPHELSGGQQQRVALARALAPDPALVLLDEPFSSLDASLRADTGRAVARALRASGATAVLVTHDQGEALSLADQVAVMSGGRFLQVSRPADIYRSPVSSEVAAFVGRATLLPATASGLRARCTLGELGLLAERSGSVVLAIRPEQVSVLEGAALQEGAGVAADVLDVSFFGHDATVRARVPGGPEGPEGIVLVRLPASAVPEAGAGVRLAVTGPVLAFDALRPS